MASAKARMPAALARRARRNPADDVAVEGIKKHWMSLPRDQQLESLRFSDHAVVQRAYHIQQVLYNSEMACYHQRVNLKFDQVGQPIVSTGLLYFKFDWAPGVPAGTGLPIAICATPHLLDLGSDFFPYVSARIGGLFPGGYPVLRHRSLVSTFEPQPNSWTQFEIQLLRLVELAVFQRAWQYALATKRANGGKLLTGQMAGRAPQNEARSQHRPLGTIDEAVVAAPAVDDLLDDWVDEEPTPSRTAKRRARKRGDRTPGAAPAIPSVIAAAPPEEAVENAQNLQPEEASTDLEEAAVVEDINSIQTADEAVAHDVSGQEVDFEGWTQVWRKARKATGSQAPGSSNCSTISGHSRNPSWMTEASRESVTEELERLGAESTPSTASSVQTLSTAPSSVAGFDTGAEDELLERQLSEPLQDDQSTCDVRADAPLVLEAAACAPEAARFVVSTSCSCGNVYAPGENFCRKCGNKREKADEKFCRTCGVKREVCASSPSSCSCGNIYADDEKYCRRCGSKRIEAEAAPSRASSAQLNANCLSRWVPLGPQGEVEEWLLLGAGAGETNYRACIKSTFWDVESVRPCQQRRARSL
eukprot:TRINITY_DN23543_c0_g1_i2.p1 TRINITY_DN23543_c0_g1~~TRINITY_DN23543_c0_g1_i2.p1  ORF type:complete len:606 (+),score=100.16 TRINITY_DN23543_c0_g1_i2:53-1819(+)